MGWKQSRKSSLAPEGPGARADESDRKVGTDFARGDRSRAPDRPKDRSRGARGRGAAQCGRHIKFTGPPPASKTVRRPSPSLRQDEDQRPSDPAPKCHGPLSTSHPPPAIGASPWTVVSPTRNSVESDMLCLRAIPGPNLAMRPMWPFVWRLVSIWNQFKCEVVEEPT
jgi:hypothetical protein